MLGSSGPMVRVLFFPCMRPQEHISFQRTALCKPSGAVGTPGRYWALIQEPEMFCDIDGLCQMVDCSVRTWHGLEQGSVVSLLA